MTQFGFELEVRSNASEVLQDLLAQGVTNHTYLHEYHCPDACCNPTGRRMKLFKAQRDCTADGEFITRVLEYGSADMDRAVNAIGHALLRSRASVAGNVGNHVHVSKEGLTAAGMVRLAHLYLRYQDDLREIASGPHAEVRGYNGENRATEYTWSPERRRRLCERYGRDYIRFHTVCEGHSITEKANTIEFRLWNAVRAPWRIRTHIGVSVAMVEAAKAGADVRRGSRRSFEEVVGPYFDGPTWQGVIRQRHSKGGYVEVAA